MNKFKHILIAILLILNAVAQTSCKAKSPIAEQEKFNSGNASPPVGTVQNTNPPDNVQSPEPSPTEDRNLPTGERVPIAGFETTLLDTDPDRVNNISIAASEISGFKVESGEVFSFNTVVGKRSSEDGYEKAKVIMNGKRKEAIGGGVCQLSSTLYNAALKSGLEIVERHSHSKDVHYVSQGNDAAVSYGTMDFKFRNSKDYPVIIEAGITGDKVFVTIFKA